VSKSGRCGLFKDASLVNPDSGRVSPRARDRERRKMGFQFRGRPGPSPAAQVFAGEDACREGSGISKAVLREAIFSSLVGRLITCPDGERTRDRALHKLLSDGHPAQPIPLPRKPGFWGSGRAIPFAMRTCDAR